MNQTMTTKGVYECPAGEERLWHVRMCPKAKFDPETGERKAKPTVHKFGRKAFRRLYPVWLTQGYEMEILHNPDEWEKEQAAKAQAQKAAGEKEQAAKAQAQKAAGEKEQAAKAQAQKAAGEKEQTVKE